jgi:hypothetical protein
VYPNKETLFFQIGSAVIIDNGHYSVTDTKVVDISFEEFASEIKIGKLLDESERKLSTIAIDDALLYVIKRWKSLYILENGRRMPGKKLRLFNKNTTI